MLETKINLVLIGQENKSIDWSLGKIYCVDTNSDSFQDQVVEMIQKDQPVAWLFWDASLGTPNSDSMIELLEKPADIIHGGLALGVRECPYVLNFITPTWMYHHDPMENGEVSSWRMTFRACLIRHQFLIQKQFHKKNYESLDALALDWGYEGIMNGARLRYSPNLAPKMESKIAISYQDELCFVRHHYCRKWLYWAMLRSVLSGYQSVSTVWAAWMKTRAFKKEHIQKQYQSISYSSEKKEGGVSVLVPTLNRHPYLQKLLSQLRDQTIQPLEIIIVDQTERENRDINIESEFSDLPIKWLHLEQPGQCGARNLGLQEAKGEYVLFLDDDDDISNDLIEKHVQTLSIYQSDVSSGVLRENGAEKLSRKFQIFRQSDVMPTGNSLIRRSLLKKSGLFDMAYDHGSRADGDLGMRFYLTGANMVLNPEIQVGHDRAAEGGLRTHGARKKTYAASRKHLFSYHLPSVTEIYLEMRYFTEMQVRESMLLRLLGIFVIRGNILLKLLKVFIGLFFLPFAYLQIKKDMMKAKEMLQTFPKIPELAT